MLRLSDVCLTLLEDDGTSRFQEVVCVQQSRSLKAVTMASRGQQAVYDYNNYFILTSSLLKGFVTLIAGVWIAELVSFFFLKETGKNNFFISQGLRNWRKYDPNTRTVLIVLKFVYSHSRYMIHGIDIQQRTGNFNIPTRPPQALGRWTRGAPSVWIQCYQKLVTYGEHKLRNNSSGSGTVGRNCSNKKITIKWG